jgi:hypothetical protein
MLLLDASFEPVGADYFALHRAIERPAFVQPAPTPDPAMTAPSQRPTWSDAVEQRLAWILSLPDNWDGYGAAHVEHETVRRAWSFLGRVIPPDGEAPDIGPTKDGRLQFEWHRLNCDLEIRMRSAPDFEVAFDDPRDPGRSWDEIISTTDHRRTLAAVREASGRP